MSFLIMFASLVPPCHDRKHDACEGCTGTHDNEQCCERPAGEREPARRLRDLHGLTLGGLLDPREPPILLDDVDIDLLDFLGHGEQHFPVTEMVEQRHRHCPFTSFLTRCSHPTTMHVK